MIEHSTTAVFAALSDATRMDVLERIAHRQDATATELAAEIPVSRQAITKHLATLEAAGLIDRARHGREVRYHFVPTPLNDAVRWITELGAEWDDRLDRLRLRFDDPGSR